MDLNSFRQKDILLRNVKSKLSYSAEHPIKSHNLQQRTAQLPF